jgi:hypothetical protein
MQVDDKLRVIKGEYLSWHGVITGVYGTLCSVRLHYRGTIANATLPQAHVMVTEAAESDENDDIYADDYIKPLYDYYFNQD